MKDFTLVSLFAIAHEMAGPWFWPAVIAAAAIAIAFLVALVRRRGFRGAAARRALGIGIVVAMLTVAAAPFATQASFANIHGAVDVAALVLIGLGTLLATTAAAYAAFGLARPA
jgi:hypothetical protein